MRLNKAGFSIRLFYRTPDSFGSQTKIESDNQDNFNEHGYQTPVIGTKALRNPLYSNNVDVKINAE